MTRSKWSASIVGGTSLLCWTLTVTSAQGPGGPVLDRLNGLPGVDQYQRMQEQLRNGPAFVTGALTVTWADDGQSLRYALGGRMHRFDLATHQATDTGEAATPAGGRSLRAQR